VAKRRFTKSLYIFLRELEQNNERAWWEENKQRYINVIREPALEFIESFGPRLSKISPHFAADPRTVGGSLMRPYRDVRFSKDKTPYKTNVGIGFRHVMGKGAHAPGFYLHLEPRSSYAGVGIWRPDATTARRVRQAINDDPATWRRAAKGKAFADVWKVERNEETMLKRVPGELDPDHPHTDDLRLKSFVASARLSQADVTSEGFDATLAAMYRRASAYARFVCEAVGAPF